MDVALSCDVKLSSEVKDDPDDALVRDVTDVTEVSEEAEVPDVGEVAEVVLVILFSFITIIGESFSVDIEARLVILGA